MLNYTELDLEDGKQAISILMIQYINDGLKGMGSHSLLFEVTIAQYLAKNVLSNPLLGPGDLMEI